ncbi:MAG: tetratricopeptide repeat protein [Promethearchaeota archaeon]
MENKSYENVEEKRDYPLIISFIALWDDELGPKIIDIYPKSNIGDPEKLAIQIFTLYQLFWESPDSIYQRTDFIVPILNLNKLAKVFLDVIPNVEIRGGFQPFIIVILVPDYFTEEILNTSNEILTKISLEFSKNRVITLKNYYNEIIQILTFKLMIKEPSFEIDINYSYTAAMEDFQAGVKLFQSQNYDQAYSILRKVLLKFEQEQHKHLIMEALYIIASILTQQKKFNKANKYFRQLETQAIELNHERYIELANFMIGFNAYKGEDFATARKRLENINISKSAFINKLQYYTIYSRILQYYENYDDALQNLLKALKSTIDMKKSDKKMNLQFQILYEIGSIYYKIAVENFKNSGIYKKEDYYTFLNEALNYLKRSSQILVELNDVNKVIYVFQLIGDLYESMGEKNKSLEFYNKALDYSIRNRFFQKEVKILKRIIQKQNELEMHEKNIDLLKNFFSNEIEYKFIDLYTIAIFHNYLGSSFLALSEKNKGLLELIRTHEILKSFKIPVQEDLEVLQQIIELYEERNENDKISYYMNEFDVLSSKIEDFSLISSKTYSPLGPVKEIWIYSTTTGVGLFSYVPESTVDIDLLGGLLTAMQQFSLQLSQKELQNMVIGEDRYMIYKESSYDFFILGRTNANVPIEMAIKILSIIYRRFWKEYTQEVKEFTGNVSHFRGFIKIIEAFDFTLEI